MSKFIFIIAETFHSKFEVEALDPENAVESFLEGNGCYIEKSSEHYGINDNEGYKGILEMFDDNTKEPFDSQSIEELAYKKTYNGERLYTLEEARTLLAIKPVEFEAAIDTALSAPAPAPAPALKSE